MAKAKKYRVYLNPLKENEKRRFYQLDGDGFTIKVGENVVIDERQYTVIKNSGDSFSVEVVE